MNKLTVDPTWVALMHMVNVNSSNRSEFDSCDSGSTQAEIFRRLERQETQAFEDGVRLNSQASNRLNHLRRQMGFKIPEIYVKDPVEHSTPREPVVKED